MEDFACQKMFNRKLLVQKKKTKKCYSDNLKTLYCHMDSNLLFRKTNLLHDYMKN